MNFGAFVEIAPGKEGLVHISKLDTKRVERVEDVVAVGDAIVVKVTDIDQQGRINLSRRDASSGAGSQARRAGTAAVNPDCIKETEKEDPMQMHRVLFVVSE